jgi:hypothetical protein
METKKKNEQQSLELEKQIVSLHEYASELEKAIGKVAVVSIDDGDNNVIFPYKLTVMENMGNAVKKMREVALLLGRISDQDNHDIEIVSGRDAATLSFLKANYTDFQKNSERLSVVLGELVQLLDLDGTGIDIYILHYVSDAMEMFRALLEEIKDIDYDKK